MNESYTVVQIKVHGAHRGYHIYKDDRPFLVPTNEHQLTRNQATAIARTLNSLEA